MTNPLKEPESINATGDTERKKEKGGGDVLQFFSAGIGSFVNVRRDFSVFRFVIIGVGRKDSKKRMFW